MSSSSFLLDCEVCGGPLDFNTDHGDKTWDCVCHGCGFEDKGEHPLPDKYQGMIDEFWIKKARGEGWYYWSLENYKETWDRFEKYLKESDE